MTLRIERLMDGPTVVFRLSGRFGLEHVHELDAALEKEEGNIALDLHDVTQIDLDVIRFLVKCEVNGAEVRRCAGYVRHWIQKERAREN
jgi:anti-anti-sigma regulatory factor